MKTGEIVIATQLHTCFLVQFEILFWYKFIKDQSFHTYITESSANKDQHVTSNTV